MKKINCAVFISDVGFGHMVRQRQVIQELLRVFKNISITVYNKNNLKILRKSFKNKIKYRENFNNIYLYKTKNGLLDLRKTKKEVYNWEIRFSSRDFLFRFYKREAMFFNLSLYLGLVF